ncbi:MAG: cytochrome P450 [Mycobacteriales bacterium]
MTVADSLQDLDFFSDPGLAEDPLDWYEAVRAQGPVWREPHHGVFVISGHEEAVQVLNDNALFSSCLSVAGPYSGPAATFEGDDIAAQVARVRDQLPLSEHLVTMDPPDHTKHRSLLMRLLTPRRLKENEDYMAQLADERLVPLIAQGRVEFMDAYARSYALLVVADLLGVPDDERDSFVAGLGVNVPGELGADDAMPHNPLEFLDSFFSRYVEERRREPRQDVLTSLATTTFPDGSTPEVADVVHIATFLFAAGQDTSARLITHAARRLAEDKDLQAKMRANPDRLGDLIEEELRLEPPVKSQFRLALTDTTVAGYDVPAGSIVMVLGGAANRDPRAFGCPAEFDIDRPDPFAHLAFGRGAHACPGGSLARFEARVTMRRLLELTDDISLDEEHHGPEGTRRFRYEPTFILRGLTDLHLVFTPKAGS